MTNEIILVTGSREFKDTAMIHAVLDGHKPRILIHGAARGADTIASRWCHQHHHVYEISVPAKWHIFGRPAGMDRNRAMIALHPDRVLAFFCTNAENKGTRGMVKLAGEAGIPVESRWSE